MRCFPTGTWKSRGTPELAFIHDAPDGAALGQPAMTWPPGSGQGASRETWLNRRHKESITLRQWASAVQLHLVHLQGFPARPRTPPTDGPNNRRLHMACQYPVQHRGKTVSDRRHERVHTISISVGVFGEHYGIFSLQFRKSRFAHLSQGVLLDGAANWQDPTTFTASASLPQFSTRL